MNATDVHPDRLTAAVKAAKTLTDKLPPTFRLGLISFSDYAEQRVAPTTDRSQVKGRSTSCPPRAARRWATGSSAGWSPRARRSPTRTAAACAGSRR